MSKSSVYLTIAIFIVLSTSSTLSANTKVNTFFDNGNGSVTDTATGLNWQQQDDNVIRTQPNAIAYCQSLNLAGKSDWRLPNIKELASLVDYRVDNPTIDDTIFPNTNSSIYWSVSSLASSTSSAWNIFFTTGVISNSGKVNSNFVRCVR